MCLCEHQKKQVKVEVKGEVEEAVTVAADKNDDICSSNANECVLFSFSSLTSFYLLFVHSYTPPLSLYSLSLSLLSCSYLLTAPTAVCRRVHTPGDNTTVLLLPLQATLDSSSDTDVH